LMVILVSSTIGALDLEELMLRINLVRECLGEEEEVLCRKEGCFCSRVPRARSGVDDDTQ
jgi:hypothetical protein